MQFTLVEYLDPVLNVLESRLPESCNVFNILKGQNKLKEQMKVYVLTKDCLETSWILVLLQDVVDENLQDISISVPKQPFATFTDTEVKEAFRNSGILDWKKPYHFSALDRRTTQIFIDLCFKEKGHIIELLPDIVYYLGKEEIAALQTSSVDSNSSKIENFIVKPLNDAAGVEFILKTWRHATPTAVKTIPNLLQRNASAGVYINGKPVAGVVLNSIGFLGMLYTLPEYRKKGYAKICMNYAIEQLVKEGFIPACSVDTFNLTSQAFQLSLGLTRLPGVVDYIFRHADPL